MGVSYLKSEWEGLLSEMGLPTYLLESITLTTWKNFTLGHPKKSQLNNLKNEIKGILDISNDFMLIGIDYDGSFTSQVIPLDDISILRELWGSFAGRYLLILANRFNLEDKVYNCNTDDELIGQILIMNKKLLLKTPDGHELLYIEIN